MIKLVLGNTCRLIVQNDLEYIEVGSPRVTFDRLLLFLASTCHSGLFCGSSIERLQETPIQKRASYLAEPPTEKN